MPTVTVEFTKNDRCDASQSEQAAVFIQLTEDPASLITLCGHHFDKNRAALEARDPYLIVDTRQEPVNRQQGDYT